MPPNSKSPNAIPSKIAVLNALHFESAYEIKSFFAFIDEVTAAFGDAFRLASAGSATFDIEHAAATNGLIQLCTPGDHFIVQCTPDFGAVDHTLHVISSVVLSNKHGC